MFIVTGEEMRRIDEAVISRFVPGLTLMERAGQGIFEAIARQFQPLDDVTASIVLGRGNNAGDGLVVARLLAETGARVHLHMLHEPGDFSPDAFKNYERLSSLAAEGRLSENYLMLPDGVHKAAEALDESDFVVDALLGTGLAKPVREGYARAIDLINESGLPVLAVDIPSGVSAETGEVLGTAVMADLTVTMALPKIGCFFYPGKAHTGGYTVVDIGVPREVIEEAGLKRRLIDFDTAVLELPRRDPAAHKFACGSLLVLAGSRRFAGAAHLAALSALRTGCGIVYLAGPESIRTAVQASAPEVIFLSQPETAAGGLSRDAAAVLGEVRFDALAIGPGLTCAEETASLVRDIASRCETPMLIDADGINAFAGRYDDLKAISKRVPVIISPHSGELARLTGADVPAIPLDRIGRLVALVAGSGVTLVHKGAPTVIAHPDGSCDINAGGHPGQATAGSGDVLTGAIAGFLAQGAEPAAAARLGVYLHSHAAGIAAMEQGERGMTAGDNMRALGPAMSELEDEILYGPEKD
jgi:NAD(P)H-hydrate epimerase